MNASLDGHNVRIESSLPRSWETETTFNDVLYDWMSRAPWLAISAIAHVVVVLILMAIPWDLLTQREEKTIITSLDHAPEDVFEKPLPEEPEEIEDYEVEEEPVLKDAEVSDHSEEDVNQDFEGLTGDPDPTADSPFDKNDSNTLIGIGGGAGGKFGGRFGGHGDLKSVGGWGTEKPVDDGLKWLRDHQSPEGYWDAKNFMHNNVMGHSCACDGSGSEVHNVGMTGLALLAFLGDGNTTRQGPYKEVVTRGVKWLKEQQDADTGLIGSRVGQGFLYDHAIATLAMCEVYYFSNKNPIYRYTAQAAVNYIAQARNPYSAWRYSVPPNGENDTSVTGWMVFALKSAEEGGLAVDHDAFTGALSWIDEVSDPATGRCGYDTIGSWSSRVPRVNDHYPKEKTEAMTAVALLCRFFMGQDPDKTPMMAKHADLLLKALPEQFADGTGKDNCNDMYYWYYGSYAMYQMGGKYWDTWNKAMKSAVLESQRREGDPLGSWDPNGPWGMEGGRVYSTALMVLSLEVYYRYSKVLGAR